MERMSDKIHREKRERISDKIKIQSEGMGEKEMERKEREG